MITRQNIGGKLNRLLFGGSPWAAVSVRLDHPHIIVVSVERDGRRSVGLTFEQDGIQIEVDLPDPFDFRADLTDAIEGLNP